MLKKKIWVIITKDGELVAATKTWDRACEEAARLEEQGKYPENSLFVEEVEMLKQEVKNASQFFPLHPRKMQYSDDIK